MKSNRNNPFPGPESILPPNAVMVSAALIIKIGGVERTYHTAVTVQTNNREEISWAINECWINTRAKENADAAGLV